MSNSTSSEPTTTFLTIFCQRKWSDFEQFLDYGNIRYHLLLTYNKDPHFYYCAENICLRALYDAFTTDDLTRQCICAKSCISLFWETLKRDYAARQYMGPSSDRFIDIYTAVNSPTVKLQAMTTGRQFGMEFSIHSSALKYPTTGSIKNIYPQVPVFLREDITLQEVLPRDIFRVKIGGRDYWLKTAYHYYDEESFSREIEILQVVPVHSTISRLIGVVVDPADGSRIDGIVFGPREGAKQLNEVEVCTKATGEKWKSQISWAITQLHARGVVWGWAVEDNVIIDEFDNATVIDFSGGPGRITEGSDLEGLGYIFRFIDDLVQKNYCDDGDDGGGGGGDGDDDGSTVVGWVRR